MKLVIAVLIFITHISVSWPFEEEDPLIFPEFSYKTDKDYFRDLASSARDAEVQLHRHSGHNPVELLLRAEVGFLVDLGIRLDVLMQSYNKLYREAGLNPEELRPRVEPLATKIFESIVLKTGEMSKELKSIMDKYDAEDFDLQLREPRSFYALESIKNIFEYINKVYEIIREDIEGKVKEESVKEKLLWALKTKTSLTALSKQIMFMKMFYDLGLKRNLKMRFIFPGIYYLLVFENGMIKRIIDEDLEEKNDFFNSFIENYQSSIEELTQRALFHIKEDELPKEEKEKLHKDLEMMHKDFKILVNPLIAINGAVLKEVSI